MSLLTHSPEVHEGTVLTHQELVRAFAVGSSGGIRYRGTAEDPQYVVVISSDPGTYNDRPDRRRPYYDRWENGTLLYTGEGKVGDQELTEGNLALYLQALRRFPVYLVRQLAVNQYKYTGQYQLQGYHQEPQRDETGVLRQAYVFHLSEAP